MHVHLYIYSFVLCIHNNNHNSLAKEALLTKACKVLASSGIASNNDTTWQLLQSKHPQQGPLPTLPDVTMPRRDILFPDFNIMAILQSYPKATASGPSGLSIQHLVEAAEIPLQVPICSSLRDMLASGQVPLSISKFLAGGSLIPLVKNKPNCPFDVQPIAVGKAIRHLVGKCLCVISRSNAHDFFSPHQCGVVCPSSAEKMVHGLRCCVEEHWTDGDFSVLHER